MNNMKRLVTLIAGLTMVFCIGAYSVPARPGLFEMKQPDGSSVTVSLHGDEYFHYYLTPDGLPLFPDEQGYLCYAVIDGSGQLSASSIRAHEASDRGEVETAFVQGIDVEAVMARMAVKQRTARAQRRAGQVKSFTDMMSSYPTIGSPKALILLVEYADVKFNTRNAQEEFTKLMTQEGYDYNGATGSAKDYFVENSCGKFTPDFQVYGPVTLPHDMAYYGAPTANMYDARPWEMITDGCRILDETTDIDFSQFDNDGDGFVDNVFVFYAGYGQNSGADINSVWPHAANIWTYYNINLTLDGVKIGNYACTNELQGNSGTVRTGIGTFCHEFSHVLGLPDMYPTDNSSGFTPGPFEVMDTGPYNNGGNTPPFMSAYDRISLRWLNPRELTGPETVTLNDIASNEAYLIKTISENEYYLFENRQQKGWDAFIPGHGMLVWHIDYDATIWKNNQVNNTPSHQRIDLVEADNLPSTTTRAGDPFPGTNNVTRFTDGTTPAMSTWTSVKINMPITDILEQDGFISFKVCGGGERIEAVEALPASLVSPTSFRANWEGRVTISKYEIDVCRQGEVVPEQTLVKETRSTADCYIDVEGLAPSTSYFYVVRAIDGNLKSSDSNPIEVTTTAPTFDMLQVVALEATGISANAFTAHWEPLEGTDRYELSVYAKDYVVPVHDVADFSAATLVPEGWYVSSSSTSGVAGTFGAARPSLRMLSDNDLISSPVYDFDINELSFWCGGSKDIEGTLLVEVLQDGGWSTLASIGLESGFEARTVSFTSSSVPSILPGTRSVRLTFQRTAGTLYIDDVDIAYNGSSIPLYADGFDHLDVGTVTEKLVGGLASGTNYFYTVTAHKGDLSSIESDEISLQTAESTGIRPAAAGGISFSRGGNALVATNPTDQEVCLAVYDLKGRLVRSCALSARTALQVPLGERGVYVVRAAGVACKVVL